MVKNPYYQQNKGRLPTDPPHYLGTVAREDWRKIIPFLEATEKVERIEKDTKKRPRLGPDILKKSTTLLYHLSEEW